MRASIQIEKFGFQSYFRTCWLIIMVILITLFIRKCAVRQKMKAITIARPLPVKKLKYAPSPAGNLVERSNVRDKIRICEFHVSHLG